MQRPCDIAFNECPGTDSPVTNASSEAPDPLLFAGTGWTTFDPFKPVPLGNGQYTEVDCTNITWSAESQEMADLLAQIASAFCQPPPPPTTDVNKTPTLPPNPNPVIPPFIWEPGSWIQPDPQLQMFANDRQEASVNCPDGSVFTLAIEAGTATALLPVAIGPSWVEYINAYLLAYILQRIWDLRVCVTVPGLTERTPPGKTPPPPPGPGTPGATFSAFPGWCCLEAELDPQFCTYNISGGSPSAVWTFSLSGGSIPSGTSLIQTGPRSAVLDGFPDVSGNYAYTITAVSGSSTITVNDTLNVFGLVTTILPSGTSWTAYSESLQGNGGTAPYTFTLLGTLPTGLVLDSDGTVHGTPTESGDFLFDVNVADSSGIVCTQTVSIAIAPFPFICGATPSNIQDCVWTPLPPNPPCTLQNNIVAGVCGSWRVYQGPPGCGSGAVSWDTTICNPGAAYNLTLTVPYVSSGTVLGDPFNHSIRAAITINGTTVVYAFGDITTDLPNPLVATVTLPAFSSCTLNVRVDLIADTPPFPPGQHTQIDSAGNLTVTPLTHP